MRLFHRQFGEANNCLVIIHGLYGSSDNWVSIARLLESHFSVFIIDQRNHGKSPHDPALNYQLMADDVKEFMHQQKIEKAIVMGHSMGGKTAMTFALQNPEMVEKLLILDIAPKSYGGESNYAKITNDHRVIVNALLSINPLEYKTRSAIDDVLKEAIPNDMVRSFLLKNIGRDENKMLYWKLNIKVISKCLDQIMNGIPVTNEALVFPEIKDVVLIRGANSFYVQDQDMHQVRKYFPSAQLSTIPNAGHWLHAEQPTLFMKTLMYFLDC